MSLPTPFYEDVDAGIQIFHGDCREIVPNLCDPIDLVLTDPPFEEEAHDITRRTRAFLEDRSVYEDIPFPKITEELRAFICNLNCNWLLTFCQAEAVDKFKQLLGPKYRRPMVWVKPDSSPQFTGDRPAMGYETIVCAWCSGGRSRWNGGGKRGVFEHQIRDGNDRVHPTQKPFPLIMELTELFSLGGTILDPFLGSGTTLLAAKRLKRKAIGIELNKDFCAIAAERLDATLKDQRLGQGVLLT